MRLNPGNIGGEDKVRAVVEAVKPLKHPYPYRRQRRFTAERLTGKIWASHAGSTGRGCLAPYPYFGKYGLPQH